MSVDSITTWHQIICYMIQHYAKFLQMNFTCYNLGFNKMKFSSFHEYRRVWSTSVEESDETELTLIETSTKENKCHK